MPNKFQTATDAATVYFNLRLGFHWQVTLGGNRTLVINNAEKGDTVTIKLIQDGTGSRTVTWPSSVAWQSGQAPTLKTAASAIDVFEFIYDGTSWRDLSGSGGSRLPSRIAQASLATVSVVNSVALIFLMSAGSGAPTDLTKAQDFLQVKAGTGGNATITAIVQSSGSLLLSSSGAANTGLGVGIDNLKTTSKLADAKAYITGQGLAYIRNTLSGYTLMGGGGIVEITNTKIEGPVTVSGSTLRGLTMTGGELTISKMSAGSGKITTTGSAGSYFCLRDNDANGWTQVSALNGVLVSNGADANTCP